MLAGFIGLQSAVENPSETVCAIGTNARYLVLPLELLGKLVVIASGHVWN